jgi:hypothetical protein
MRKKVMMQIPAARTTSVGGDFPLKGRDNFDSFRDEGSARKQMKRATVFSASAQDLGLRNHMHSANPSAYDNLKPTKTAGQAFWSGKISSIRPPSR